MRATNILHLGVKELRSLVRDPILVVLIFFSFTFSVYTSATAQPETLHKAPIAIVDEDRSPLSARIADAFYPPYFLPPEFISAKEMDTRMDDGVDTFALDIPSGFQRDVLAGRSPALQLNVDATRMNQAFTGSGYIQSIVTGEVNAFVQRYRASDTPVVDLALRARFNPELNKSWFGAVMEVINSITMLSLVLTGAALIREREHGTVEHLLVMPVTPFEIMSSKVWSMALVVLVAAGLSLTFVVQGLLKVPIEGSIVLFLTGAALHLFATTSMGIFLATVHAHDAAVRPPAHAGDDAAADPVGQHDAAGKHAGGCSVPHADNADHPFRRPRPGHPVSRCGAVGSVAAFRRPRAHRDGFFLCLPGALSEGHRDDGMMKWDFA